LPGQDTGRGVLAMTPRVSHGSGEKKAKPCELIQSSANK